MSNFVDHVQHQLGAEEPHEHTLFAQVQFAEVDHHNDDHDHGSDQQLNDSDSSSDHPVGTAHHHHADGSSSLILLVSHDTDRLFSRSSSLYPASDANMSGTAVHGPERPPRPSSFVV